MGREIKFRAWDKADGVHRDESSMSYGVQHDCDADVIMQYTGLKDKNGVEIYDGDIIRCIRNCITKEGEVVYSVGFYDGCFGVDSRSPLWNLVYSFRPEVIGNIYENPELLGGNNG